MTKHAVLASLLTLILAAPAAAEFPKNWYVEGVRDMLAGQIVSTALQADGALVLAENFKALSPRLSSSGVLDALPLKDGSVLVAASQPGQILHVRDSQADPKVLLSLDKGLVTALAQARDGRIYAASAPDAQIFVASKAGESFKPLLKAPEGYVWDMLTTPEGKTYFVTGNGGALYELVGDKAELRFRAKESNLRSLYHDTRWGLIVGGGSQGTVYKYLGPNKVEAVLGTPFDEITAITGDGKGNLYIAANRTQPRQNEAKSVVYYVNAQGQSEALFPLDGETAYSLALDTEGTLLIGTGNAGRLYAISSPTAVEKRTLSLVARSDSNQISGLLAHQSQVLVLGSNPGRVEAYGRGYRKVGVYESDILSTGIASSWGTLLVNSVTPSGTRIVAWSRSGNTEKPDETWSDWSAPYNNPKEVQISSPRGHYLQLKFELHSNDPRQTPQVHSFEVNFLRDNLSPAIQQVYFLQRGVYFTPHTVGQMEGPRSTELNSQALGKLRRPRSSDEVYQELLAAKMPPRMRMIQQYRPGMLTLAWDAEDPNQDALSFDVAYRPYGESKWKMLAQDLTQPVYSFDSTSLMDGMYHFRVYAKDELSNPGNGYTVYRDSELISIDNTPPVLRNLSARVDGKHVEVRFEAEDVASPLAYAEYALNGHNADLIAPVDGIVDSRKERFVLRFAKPAPGSHDIVVRVVDRQGNSVTGKARVEVR